MWVACVACFLQAFTHSFSGKQQFRGILASKHMKKVRKGLGDYVFVFNITFLELFIKSNCSTMIAAGGGQN